MPEIRIIKTLREINSGSWNTCFPDVIENYQYLLAVEEAGINGFCYAYVTAWEHGKLVAAMPAFITNYALDTTLQGTGKKITTAIASTFPNLLKVKLACLGSPCTEAGIVGFHPQISDMEKRSLLQTMIEEFERYAATQGCKLIGIKDIPKTMENIWKPTAQALSYASLAGMPTAYLDINFASVDEYIAQLSSTMRKDMRRKLRQAEMVEIITTKSLDNILPEVIALYHDTKNRSDWQFEELTENYFKGILTNMPTKSFCTLYYFRGQLLAANLLVHDEHTLIDKFFCMNEAGRAYNLYYLSWFTNVSYCLEHGLKHYHSGQEGYENKLRLGSKLLRNIMYFKHRNTLAQSILKMVSPLLAADETLKVAA